MKCVFSICISFFLMLANLVATSNNVFNKQNVPYEYCVLGSGPAGIIAVGGLLDKGVDAKDILWVAQEFEVGNLGKYLRHIKSNMIVNVFTAAFKRMPAFKAGKHHEFVPLKNLDPEEYCPLGEVVDFLQAVTNDFRKQVTSTVDKVAKLTLRKQTTFWELAGEITKYRAHKVILATGRQAAKLDILPDAEVVPLEVAYNPELLKRHIGKDDVVAVFGDYHGAFWTMKLMLELGADRVFHFEDRSRKLEHDIYDYRAEDISLCWLVDWFVNQSDDYVASKKLTKLIHNNDNVEMFGDEVTKVVYGLGYKRPDIVIEAGGNPVEFDVNTSKICHNLFGIGFAYGEYKENPNGIRTYFLEIKNFVDRMHKCIGYWMA